MLGLTWMHRSAWLVAMTCASGCQILNPAFGLVPESGTTGGTASDGSTEPGLTTSDDPTTTAGPTTTTTDPGTSVGTATIATTASTEPPLTTTGVDTDVGTATTIEPNPTDCGNAVVDPGETCDDGDQDDTDDCPGSCQWATCGDGFVQAGKEQCDSGGVATDDCNLACIAPYCGDGDITGDEQCDDQNTEDFDGCASDCKITCGDGMFQPDREECDPTAELFGNILSVCSEACELKTCFRLKNTDQPDFLTDNWFDDCAKAQGSRVAILLRDPMGIHYLSVGEKEPNAPEWTPVSMTSPVGPAGQWKLGGHTNKIHLKNLLADKPEPDSDVLYLFGATGKPNPPDSGTCPSSLGDGYGLAILPEQNVSQARVLLMPYEGLNLPRNLGNWQELGPGVELAFAQSNLMALCKGMGSDIEPFLGTVAVAVF